MISLISTGWWFERTPTAWPFLSDAPWTASPQPGSLDREDLKEKFTEEDRSKAGVHAPYCRSAEMCFFSGKKGDETWNPTAASRKIGEPAIGYFILLYDISFIHSKRGEHLL